MCRAPTLATHQSAARTLAAAPQPERHGLVGAVDGGPVQEGGLGVDLVTLRPAAVGGGPREVETLLPELGEEGVAGVNLDRVTMAVVPESSCIMFWSSVFLFSLDIRMTAVKEVPGSGQDVVVHELSPLHHEVCAPVTLRQVGGRVGLHRGTRNILTGDTWHRTRGSAHLMARGEGSADTYPVSGV